MPRVSFLLPPYGRAYLRIEHVWGHVLGVLRLDAVQEVAVQGLAEDQQGPRLKHQRIATLLYIHHTHDESKRVITIRTTVSEKDQIDGG